MRRDRLPELLFRLDSPAPFDLYFVIERKKIISSYDSFDPDNEMHIKVETNTDPFPMLCKCIIDRIGITPNSVKVRYYGKVQFVYLIARYRRMRFKKPWYVKLLSWWRKS